MATMETQVCIQGHPSTKFGQDSYCGSGVISDTKLAVTHTHVHGQNDRQTQKITIKCPFTKISDPVHKMLGHNIGPLNGSHLPSNFCVQCPSSVGDMGVLMQKKWQSDHNISSPHNICG